MAFCIYLCFSQRVSVAMFKNMMQLHTVAAGAGVLYIHLLCTYSSAVESLLNEVSYCCLREIRPDPGLCLFVVWGDYRPQQ